MRQTQEVLINITAFHREQTPRKRRKTPRFSHLQSTTKNEEAYIDTGNDVGLGEYSSSDDTE